MSIKYHYAFINIRKETNGEFAFVISFKHFLLVYFIFNNSEICSYPQSNYAAPCELVLNLHDSNIIRSRRHSFWFKEKLKSISCSNLLILWLKRISNEFSFHTMYYETHCQRLRYIKHTTRHWMKTHLRSYIVCIIRRKTSRAENIRKWNWCNIQT